VRKKNEAYGTEITFLK